MGVLLQLGPLYSKHFFKEKVIEIDKYFIGSLLVHYNNNSMRNFHNNGFFHHLTMEIALEGYHSMSQGGATIQCPRGGGVAGWSIYRGQMIISTRRDENLKFYYMFICQVCLKLFILKSRI